MDIESAKFYYYQEMVSNLGVEIKHTITIDYKEMANIAYLKLPGSQPVFTFFECIEANVYLLMGLMTILVTLLISRNNFNMLTFFNYLWNILTIFLSKMISKDLDMKSRLSKVIMGAWLFLEFYFTILCGSFLMEHMNKPIPYRVIDSWDDLYQMKEVKILTSKTSTLVKFTQLENTPMAMDFRQRLEALPQDTSDTFRRDMFQKVSSGKYAYSTNRLVLIGNMFMLLNSSVEYLTRFHISKKGGGEQPYFLAVHSTFDQGLLDSLDQM